MLKIFVFIRDLQTNPPTLVLWLKLIWWAVPTLHLEWVFLSVNPLLGAESAVLGFPQVKHLFKTGVPVGRGGSISAPTQAPTPDNFVRNLST
jgi:hypothetical protein